MGSSRRSPTHSIDHKLNRPPLLATRDLVDRQEAPLACASLSCEEVPTNSIASSPYGGKEDAAHVLKGIISSVDGPTRGSEAPRFEADAGDGVEADGDQADDGMESEDGKSALLLCEASSRSCASSREPSVLPTGQADAARLEQMGGSAGRMGRLADAQGAATGGGGDVRTDFLTEWLDKNYAESSQTSLPRSTVYELYLEECQRCAIGDAEIVNPATFGKFLRAIFPRVQTRRLGTRGNSKYHYFGIQPLSDRMKEIFPNIEVHAPPVKKRTRMHGRARGQSASSSLAQIRRSRRAATLAASQDGTVVALQRAKGADNHRGRRGGDPSTSEEAVRSGMGEDRAGARGDGELAKEEGRPDHHQSSREPQKAAHEAAQGSDGNRRSIRPAAGESQSGHQGRSQSHQRASYGRDASGATAPSPQGEARGAPLHGQQLPITYTPLVPNFDEFSRFVAQICQPIREVLPPAISLEMMMAFSFLYQEHIVHILRLIAARDFPLIEMTLGMFWNNIPAELAPCLHSAEGLRIVSIADDYLFQVAIHILIPDVLECLPLAVAQSIRYFAKSLEVWMCHIFDVHIPEAIVRGKVEITRRFCQVLRRRTSLNHLSQAVRAILASADHVSQMLYDFSAIDFGAIREQASWIVPGHEQLFVFIENSFRTYLFEGATIGQWTGWVESIVEECISSGRARLCHAPTGGTLQRGADAKRGNSSRGAAPCSGTGESAPPEGHRAVQAMIGEILLQGREGWMPANGGGNGAITASRMSLGMTTADLEEELRALTLKWFFFGTMVMRDMTLRSAASFGSYHLMRLFLEEYVMFYFEKKLDEHRRATGLISYWPPLRAPQRGRDGEEVLLDDDDDGEDSLGQTMAPSQEEGNAGRGGGRHLAECTALMSRSIEFEMALAGFTSMDELFRRSGLLAYSQNAAMTASHGGRDDETVLGREEEGAGVKVTFTR